MHDRRKRHWSAARSRATRLSHCFALALLSSLLSPREGMGGMATWADPANRLGVAVLKSTYEPLAALGGSISPDLVVIADAIRAVVVV